MENFFIENSVQDKAKCVTEYVGVIYLDVNFFSTFSRNKSNKNMSNLHINTNPKHSNRDYTSTIKKKFVEPIL